MNSSALNTSTAGTTASASTVPLRVRFEWCERSMAAAMSLLFTALVRRGMDVDVDALLCRGGESEGRCGEGFWSCGLRGGEGRGMWSSVYNGVCLFGFAVAVGVARAGGDDAHSTAAADIAGLKSGNVEKWEVTTSQHIFPVSMVGWKCG